MISTRYFDHRSEEIRSALASTKPEVTSGLLVPNDTPYLLSFWRKTGYLCRRSSGTAFYT
jgi:hypothetical protein